MRAHFSAAALGALLSTGAWAATYYVDCAAGSDSNDGGSGSPWLTLQRAAGITFQPNDQLLIKRGTACSGPFAPQGSGAMGSPITLGPYGTGPAPVIYADAGAPSYVVQLGNQTDWRITGLDLTGTAVNGLLVFADAGSGPYDGIQVDNLHVHDLGGLVPNASRRPRFLERMRARSMRGQLTGEEPTPTLRTPAAPASKSPGAAATRCRCCPSSEPFSSFGCSRAESTESAEGRPPSLDQ